VSKVRILVVVLSESFSSLWERLESTGRVTYSIVGSNSPIPLTPDVAAVVLAAGGVEKAVADWLEEHEVPAGVPVYAVGADPGRRIAAYLVGRGASDYFAVPDDVELLTNVLSSAVDRRSEAMRRDARDAQRAKCEVFANIIGESQALKRELARAERILPHGDATALIVGETGTGKELLAQALHDGGPRRNAPFVAVNCSALPDNLAESELFGHERGAFTDAHAAKPGLFEIADGGTLFLDELGTLSADVQAKLLRVLEDQQIRRVGGTKVRHVNVRIIAATNQALEESIQTGRFREDLYFRLSVIILTLPPLRERGDDVMLIANALLTNLAARHDVPVPPLGAEVVETLRAYQWPGNVRELKNAVERALLLSPPGQLDVREVIPRAYVPRQGDGPIPFPAELCVITEAAVNATVDLCAGNRSEAARRLGISRQRLRRLLDPERQSA